MRIVPTILRGIGGAIIGAILGAILVFALSNAIENAIGNDGGWALGMALVFWLAPASALGGALIGGRAGALGWRSSAFRTAMKAAAVLIVGVIGVSIALPDNTPKPEIDANGCTSAMRDVSQRTVDDRSIVVYDRYCPGEGGHTQNVSVMHAWDTPSWRLDRPGNALVLAVEPKERLPLPGRTPPMLVAQAIDSTHAFVSYPYGARVISQASPVLGYEIRLEPDSGLVIERRSAAPAPINRR